MITELQWVVPRDGDVNVGPDEIDHALAMLNTIEGTHIPNSGTDTDPNVPKSLDKAQKSADWPRWEKLYQDKLDSLEKLGVWELVLCEKVPAGKKILKGQPVFSIKCNEQGKITWLKTHHVLQGFSMVQGRDYEKTTSPTVHTESWRILLHLTAKLDWDATQVDIKMTFLNGVLPEEEQIYM